MSSKTKWMGLGTVVMACVAGACTNVEGGAARDGARDPREESGTKPPVSVVAEDFGSAEGPRAAYDGKGFVVHEWGTDTLVVGSDGSLQVGLHHEEEDLPPFVEDRLKAGAFPTNVEVKMETPVTYFYADRPLSVEARVRFPKGAFTQWFPRAQTIAPKLVGAGDNYLLFGIPWRGGYRRPSTEIPSEGTCFSPCGASAAGSAPATSASPTSN